MAHAQEMLEKAKQCPASKSAAPAPQREPREGLEMRLGGDTEIVFGHGVVRHGDLGQIGQSEPARWALFRFALGEKLVTEGARNEIAQDPSRIAQHVAGHAFERHADPVPRFHGQIS